MSWLARRLARFLPDEDASASVEFVVLFPPIFGLFLATFELGMVLTREAMLDRGLDLTVRDVRLGRVPEVTHDVLKEMICNRAMMIPDCRNQLRLEMVPRDPRAWASLPRELDCVDRANPAEEVREFTPGVSNELMILRVCALIDPYFTPNIMGWPSISRPDGEAFIIHATTAFVIEPQ